MKLIYTLVVLAALALSAQAAPERITTGPYTVSFDLNTTMNYTVEILPAREMGNQTYTKYQIIASTNNSSWATVAIDDYRDLQDSNIKDELRYRVLVIGKENGTFAGERIIDGKKGVFNNITRSNGDQFSDAFYWLDSKKCECGPVYVGRVSVEVLSTYPRDTVENLLRTINVTSSEVPSAVQPQAQAATETGIGTIAFRGVRAGTCADARTGFYTDAHADARADSRAGASAVSCGDICRCSAQYNRCQPESSIRQCRDPGSGQRWPWICSHPRQPERRSRRGPWLCPGPQWSEPECGCEHQYGQSHESLIRRSSQRWRKHRHL